MSPEAHVLKNASTVGIAVGSTVLDYKPVNGLALTFRQALDWFTGLCRASRG
jgi:hypothetical protein